MQNYDVDIIHHSRKEDAMIDLLSRKITRTLALTMDETHI